MKTNIDFVVEMDIEAFAASDLTTFQDYLDWIKTLDENFVCKFTYGSSGDSEHEYNCSLSFDSGELRQCVDGLFAYYHNPMKGISLKSFIVDQVPVVPTPSPLSSSQAVESAELDHVAGDPVYECVVHFRSGLPKEKIVELVAVVLGAADYSINSNGIVVNEWLARFKMLESAVKDQPEQREPDNVASSLIWLALTEGNEKAQVNFSLISSNAVLVAG